MASSPPESLFFLQEESLEPIFVKEIDEIKKCVQCTNVLKPPVKMLFCGHRMCGRCLAKLVQSAVSTRCPGKEEECGVTNLTNTEHVFPDNGTARELKKLQVYCNNREYGCQQQLPWEKLEEHLKICEFKPAECKYREYGCLEKKGSKFIKGHEGNCNYKPVECIHCSKLVPKKEMDEGHADMCASRPKPCQFESMGCKFVTIDKEELQKHIGTDHKEHIEILFKHFKKMEEKENNTKIQLEEMKKENQTLKTALQKAKKETVDMKQNFEKKIQHTQKLAGSNAERIIDLESIKEPAKLVPNLQQTAQIHETRISKLESNQSSGTMSGDVRSKISTTEQSISMHDIRLAEFDLRFQCLETASYDGNLVWKIRDYTRRKQEAITGRTLSLYSQPFYTSKFGYKMCARVYLNGDGMGKGTHLSLFFVIMKGDYDALLPWPFRQKVTLTLLDQESGRRSLSDTFRPDPTSTSFKKPTAEMNVASGCPLFVAQSVLESSNHLKEDTIFIKIAVDTNDLNCP